MKTIVAISTPIGNGGISIVRMSGSNSFSIAKKMVSKLKSNDLNFENRKMTLCKIKAEKFFDIGLVVFFKNPESFTGEDLVEFQIHGGVFIANEILKECLKQGAAMAEPGEFSKRAFLNGKTSLEKCEGVIDLINSESDAQVKAASELASGEFFVIINKTQNELKNIIAEIDVSLDYPDENLELDSQARIRNRIERIKQNIEQISKTFDEGKIIKHGINCAIIGLPNAGKSSLLNALLNENRAIVSDIAGTTRDVIKESFLINGLKVNLIDTAGINDASNEIEKIGVERAIKEANLADVVLYLFDSSKKFSKQDEDIINKLKTKKIILVKNKKDISINEKNKIFEKFECVEISATIKENINLLKDKIYELFSQITLKNEAIIITNERHFNALKKAILDLEESLKLSTSFSTFDVISSFIHSAYNHLGEITGETGSEQIIDEIFSKFCLGK